LYPHYFDGGCNRCGGGRVLRWRSSARGSSVCPEAVAVEALGRGVVPGPKKAAGWFWFLVP